MRNKHDVTKFRKFSSINGPKLPSIRSQQFTPRNKAGASAKKGMMHHDVCTCCCIHAL